MTEEQEKLIKEVINQHSKTLKQLANAINEFRAKIKDLESDIKAICMKIDNNSTEDIPELFRDIFSKKGKK